MRILFLALDVDLSRQRGDAIHVTELALAFHSLGHDVTLVVGRLDTSRGSLTDDLAVHEVRGSDLAIVQTARRLLRGSDVDVIYERRYTPKIGFALHSILGVPLVLEVNGILREELAQQSRAAESRSIVKDRIRNVLMRRVDRFVAVSEAIREDLIRTCGVEPSQVHVVGNGVNVDRFRPVSKEEACRSTGLAPSVFRAAFVGNLVGWRDFTTLLEALSAMEDRGDAELLLVGSGPAQERISGIVHSLGLANAVRFEGEVPYERVPSYISSADICLLPEKVRTVDISPLKLFEYLACARPVLAARVRGLELVESLDVGRLYEPANLRSFTEAFENLRRDPSSRSEMGTRGRRFVERERAWASVAGRVTQVLQEAVLDS